jgi:hypothetical protein
MCASGVVVGVCSLCLFLDAERFKSGRRISGESFGLLEFEGFGDNNGVAAQHN